MNNPLQFRELEANLERMRSRMPDMPQSGVLLSRLLIHLGRGMAAMLEQQIRPFGLTEAEFRVLTALFSQPAGTANPSELCARTSQSAANMSRISDSLVARNLITRDSSVQDRRKMVLRITESGEDLVRRLLPKLFGPLREALVDISEDEQLRLIGQMQRLCLRVDAALLHHVAERGE